MAISVVAAPGVNVGINGADIAILTGSVIEGDIVFAFGGHGITHDATVGVREAGWTTLINDAAARPALFLGYRVVGVGETEANFTGIGEGNAEDACAYGRIALRGFDPANIEDVARTLASGTSINPNPAAITTVTDGALIIAFALSMSNDAAFNVPSGYTGAIIGTNETTDDASIGIAYLAQVTAGAENPGTFNPWNSEAWKTVTMAIRPAGAGGGIVIPTPSLLNIMIG